MIGLAALVGCSKSDSTDQQKVLAELKHLREENKKLRDELPTIEAAATNLSDKNFGFHSILGPRSSQLQLVLNSLFHMDSSPDLVSAADYRIFRDKYKRFYKRAVPIAVGDNYKNYRVVGTTHEFFEVGYSSGRKYELAMGEMFVQNEKQWNKEAVIGATVAEKLDLNVNDKFNPYHGMNFRPGQNPHKDEYSITGIMKSTETPVDRVIWIPIEGLRQMDGHDEKYAGDVSAILIQMSDNTSARAFGVNSLDMIYNRGTDNMTFVKSIEQTLGGLDSWHRALNEADEIIKRWP